MKIKKITYSLSAIALLMTSLQATSLKDVVDHTMQNNQDIVSKSLNNEAFKKYIDEQKGGYYPKLDAVFTISPICVDVLKRFFPEQKDKIHLFENISSLKVINKLAEEPIDIKSSARANIVASPP